MNTEVSSTPKPKATHTEFLSTRMTPEEAAFVTRIQEETGCSRSEVMRHALRWFRATAEHGTESA